MRQADQPRERPTEDAFQEIVLSAQRLGMELNAAEMGSWLAAIESEGEDDLAVDHQSGTFGHRLAMLDFSPRDLARFRKIGAIVELTGPADTTEGALALSGSAAQSKIQSYPGDADFFQRFNIVANTRTEACNVLAECLKAKILAFAHGDGYQFLEAKLGSSKSGSPLSWTLDDIEAGVLETPDGPVTWADAAQDPGWVKADWVVVDAARGGLSNASNVIDVTWEGPDGEIVPLDGYLDAYFQEVYLDADDVPTFTKVVAHVSDDALDHYVTQLENEVRKYLKIESPNYGKAAKRMYNVFRLSGRHQEAAFVRELFDEPTTILYQVWSLITALDNATQPGATIPLEAVRRQVDALVLEVIKTLEGAEESEIVAALQTMSRTLETQELTEERAAQVAGARARVINVVNTFFHDKLNAVPTIRDYMQSMH